MQDNFGSCFLSLNDIRKIVIKESIKDLENVLNEIENDTEEVEILLVKRNGDKKYVDFKHNGYMKGVIKEMLVEGFEEIKEIHKKILAECREREV
ncbi:hypothetical protein KWK86_017305 [Clostridioides difficile]|nr:hypothetical protein [Clostridioides difficile]